MTWIGLKMHVFSLQCTKTETVPNRASVRPSLSGLCPIGTQIHRRWISCITGMAEKKVFASDASSRLQKRAPFARKGTKKFVGTPVLQGQTKCTINSHTCHMSFDKRKDCAYCRLTFQDWCRCAVHWRDFITK